MSLSKARNTAEDIKFVAMLAILFLPVLAYGLLATAWDYFVMVREKMQKEGKAK